MSRRNKYSQQQSEKISQDHDLQEIQFIKNQTSDQDSSGLHNQEIQNYQLKQETPNQFQSTQENKIKQAILSQENGENQFYILKKQTKKSKSLDIKKQNQTQQSQLELPQQKISQYIRSKSLFNREPSYYVRISITQYSNNGKQTEIYLSPELAVQDLRNEIKRKKNVQQNIQVIQSNQFYSQSTEIFNRSSQNQQEQSNFNEEYQQMSQNGKESSLDIQKFMDYDPLWMDKQDILSNIFQILQNKQIKSSRKRHSILEDSFQLCFLLSLDVRKSVNNLLSQQFFSEVCQKYHIDRNYSAFIRRFYHLKLFLSSWTVLNLQKIYDIISNSEQCELENYRIEYNIIKKAISFPSQTQKKDAPQKPNVIQEIITNSQSKKIVLSLTTKFLCQYVDISAREIDEDIEEFEDELQFIDMILKLIPLVL